MWNCRCKVPWLSSDDFLGRLRLRRGARGLCKRARNATTSEIDLEGVVLVALGVAQQRVCRASERRRIGRSPAQLGFGLWIAPRFMRNPAGREAPLPDRVAIELE